MPDDLKKKGPLDRQQIHVDQSYELDYWTKELGVTEAKLKKAVDEVGNWVKDVKKYLGIE